MYTIFHFLKGQRYDVHRADTYEDAQHYLAGRAAIERGGIFDLRNLVTTTEDNGIYLAYRGKPND
jgi:hypothetical protein